MRKFMVTVNGESFEVEIEEIGGQTAAAPVVTAPVITAPVSAVVSPPPPKAVPASVPQVKAAPKAAAQGSKNEVVSPLPGTISNIVAKEGQAVKAREVVMVVEAMKMENEIVAPADGMIGTLNVKIGDSVQAGDVLFTMK